MNQRLAFQKTRVEALQKAIDARQELMKVLRNCMEPDIQINGEIFHVVI